jgi:hypothetical protein
MAESALIAVDTGRGLTVWHTREEYERLMRGVDFEASVQMSAPLELEPEEESP